MAYLQFCKKHNQSHPFYWSILTIKPYPCGDPRFPYCHVADRSSKQLKQSLQRRERIDHLELAGQIQSLIESNGRFQIQSVRLNAN